MDFDFELAGQVGVFHLTGNLIGEKDGIPLTDSFSKHLDQSVKQFVIDLKDLQHINSTGLGVLITLLTKARKVGGEVVLAQPSQFIRDLLVMTKLNTIFEIHDDRAAAVEALQEKAGK
jgi:anti-sigma B factor antagonist